LWNSTGYDELEA
jgi:hypothetical protein